MGLCSSAPDQSRRVRRIPSEARIDRNILSSLEEDFIRIVRPFLEEAIASSEYKPLGARELALIKAHLETHNQYCDKVFDDPDLDKALHDRLITIRERIRISVSKLDTGEHLATHLRILLLMVNELSTWAKETRDRYKGIPFKGVSTETAITVYNLVDNLMPYLVGLGAPPPKAQFEEHQYRERTKAKLKAQSYRCDKLLSYAD